MYNPQIFILPEFAATFEKKNTSQRILNAVKTELKRLKAISKEGLLFDYLKNQNGKKLKGHENQFKYRMNSGDRIFYTYGQYIKGTKPEEANAIFIYAYSKHDNQDRQIIPEYEEPVNVTDEDFEKGYFKNSGFSNAKSVNDLFDSFTEWKQTHSAYVMSNINISDSLDDLDVYLSEEQDQIVSQFFIEDKPLLILGGAGTGKTIMALHIMHDFKVANPKSRCIYFTQSEALLRRANNKYKYIVNTSTEQNSTYNLENVEFQNINDFCIEYYNNKNIDKLLYKNQFSSNDFYNYAATKIDSLNTNKDKFNISIYDLWAEIRGTIKGGLNNNWQRPHVFNITNFNKDFISDLKELNLIEQEEQLFKIIDFNKTQNYLTNYSDDKDKKYVDLLLKNSQEVDFETNLISKNDYYKINEEFSTLPEEIRKKLYVFALNYQNFLKDNNKYDDNDLIMKLLSCKITEEDKYDFIVIDEIQDYTELQIYAIMKFAKKYNSIVMSGDSHQIINPTIFNESRLKQFFYGQTELAIKELHRNFRCPNEIVKIANASTEISRNLIAATSANIKEKSEFNSVAPFFLSYSKQNLLNLTKTLLQYPNTVVLVPDENTKSELIKEIGLEEYENSKNPIVNTVAEIKGMEYKYVVTYNIVSHFNKQWSNIFSGDAKKQTRYRYYFNLFYVAITRSQQYLCLIENSPNQLIESIWDELHPIESTNTDKLMISHLTHNDDDWFDLAVKEYQAGNYNKALITLEKLSHYESKEKTELIHKCQMYQAYNENDFETSLKLAVLLNENFIIKQSIQKAEISFELKELVSVLQSPEKLKNKDKLLNSIKLIYPNTNDQSLIINNFLSNFGNYIFNSAINMKITNTGDC